MPRRRGRGRSLFNRGKSNMGRKPSVNGLISGKDSDDQNVKEEKDSLERKESPSSDETIVKEAFVALEVIDIEKINAKHSSSKPKEVNCNVFISEVHSNKEINYGRFRNYQDSSDSSFEENSDNDDYRMDKILMPQEIQEIVLGGDIKCVTIQQDDAWDDPCMSDNIMYEEVIGEEEAGKEKEPNLMEENLEMIKNSESSVSEVTCKKEEEVTEDLKSINQVQSFVVNTTSDIKSSDQPQESESSKDIEMSVSSETEILSSETEILSSDIVTTSLDPSVETLSTLKIETDFPTPMEVTSSDISLLSTVKQIEDTVVSSSDNVSPIPEISNSELFEKRMTRSKAAGKTPVKKANSSKSRKIASKVKTSNIKKTPDKKNNEIYSTASDFSETGEKTDSSETSDTNLSKSAKGKKISRKKGSTMLSNEFSDAVDNNNQNNTYSTISCDQNSLMDFSNIDNPIISDLECPPISNVIGSGSAIVDKVKKEISSLLSLVAEKSKPMSPKELFKKTYSADIGSVENTEMKLFGDYQPLSLSVVTDCSDKSLNSFDIKKESPSIAAVLSEKTKPMSPKELIMKNYSAEMSGDSLSDSSSTVKVESEDDKQLFNFRSRSSSSVKQDSDKGRGLSSPQEGSKGLVDDEKGGHCIATVYDTEKPVKVKSRWRRTSELEMGTLPKLEDVNSTSEVKPPFIFTFIKDDPVVEARLKTFTLIEENEYLTERYISKETKRMLCDCSITKEEIVKGEKGCGDDCLNRLLLIECGSKCSLGNHCSNKRFVNKEYSKCDIVDTKTKGMGLISSENLPRNQFIMEYVGEVLDPKEFQRRAKDYSKEKNAHFYFMSLKSDTVIDATLKGNISRFINHSCDPNAETQKWTVNGELRIGFFSKRPIAVGEEITFDYQLQRYGKEAQKCLCGSSNCRGWLGEDPDKVDDKDFDEEKERDEERDDKGNRRESRKEKKEKKKKEGKRKDSNEVFNDLDLEHELEKLSATGLKNQKQTLTLSRLMVRAEDVVYRSQLLDITKAGDTRCLRLFLDYNGLNLILSWMVDPRSTTKLKLQILDILSILPIQNKTILKDSKVLSIVEKWSRAEGAINDSKERSSTEEENSSSPKERTSESAKTEGEDDKKVPEGVLSEEVKEGGSWDGGDSEGQSREQLVSPEDVEASCLAVPASNLVNKWASLKEEFRIPKKQRVEQMKEHEREANMGYADPRENQSYHDRRRWRDRKESRFDRVSRFDKERRPTTDEWWRHEESGNRMSKAERRQLFEMKVEKEERERKESEEMWWSHQEQCAQLGVDPLRTAMYHPGMGGLVYFHSQTNSWLPQPEGLHDDGYSRVEGVGPQGGFLIDPQQPPPPGFHLEVQVPQHPYQLEPPQFQVDVPPHQLGYVGDTHSKPPQFLEEQANFQNRGRPPLLPTPHCPPLNQAPLPPQVHQIPPPLPLQGPPPPLPHQIPPPFPHQPPPLPQTGPPLLRQGPPLPHQVPPLPSHQGLPLQLPHQVPPLPLTNRPPPPLPHQIPPLPRQAPPPLPQQAPPLPLQNFVSPPLPGQKPPLPGTLMSQPRLQQNVSSPQVVPQPMNQNHPPRPVFPTLGQPPHLHSYPPPLKLPPKWKAAKDKEGRTYYYHVKTRKSQWTFPQVPASTNSDSSSADEESDSSEDEEDEDEEFDDDSSTDTEQDNNNKGAVYEEEEEAECDIDTNGKKKRLKVGDIEESSPLIKRARDTLVKINIIPRDEVEHVKGITKSKIRDNKEKVKREKMRQRRKAAAAASGLSSGAAGAAKCEADTSSGPKRRIKDMFRLKMADVVVASLNQYRKADCKMGRITSTSDFKSLARKLTHFIMLKELRHCVNVEDLQCNDNVKHKARDFIRKYMSKFGPVYVNSQED